MINKITLCILTSLFVGSAPALAEIAEIEEFDSFASGELITTQLKNTKGIFFPNGIITKSDSYARSAENIVSTRSVDEFTREPLIIKFDEGQNFFSFYVQGELESNVTHWAIATAFDADGVAVASDGITFSRDTTDWQYLSVVDPSENFKIKLVRIIGGQIGFQNNFLIFDDFEFTGGVSPEVNNIRPIIYITKPAPDEIFTSPSVNVEFTASDNKQLVSVSGEIRSVYGRLIRTFDYCGTALSGPCSNPFRYNKNIWLESVEAGKYKLDIIAEDRYEDRYYLGIARESSVFEIDLPLELPNGSVKKVEINQGVQSRLFDIGAPNDDRFVNSSAVLVAGRDTVVRFYPLVDGALTGDFSGKIRSRINYKDGRIAEHVTQPNAGRQAVPLVTKPEDAGQLENEYLLMRTQLDRTLNYVIPSTQLLGARTLEVRLENAGQPVTGWLRVSLEPEVNLVIHELELSGSAFPTGLTYASDEQLNIIYRYMEEAFPAAKIIRNSLGSYQIGADDLCYNFVTDIMTASDCATWQFSRYGITTTPSTQIPTYEVALGLMPYDSFGGKATNHSAISEARVTIVAHEIGHTIGRPHIEGHNETGAEAWPHPHGLVGDRDFGIISTQKSTVGFGQWELFVVDPCPFTISDRSAECQPELGIGTHDIMSYGRGGTALGPLTDIEPADEINIRNNWVSTLTWNRLYHRMRYDGHVAAFAASLSDFDTSEASASSSESTQKEALLIDAFISESDVQPLPVLRLFNNKDITEPVNGPYSLELYNVNNELTYSRSFDVSEMHDAGEESLFLLDQRVPYQADLARVVVYKDDIQLFERTRSATAPTVEVLCPLGGRDDVTGKYAVYWDTSDADGDPVISSIFFSDNEGESWQSLGMVGNNEAHELEVNAAEFSAFNTLRFRVAVSDGFLTSVAESDCSLDPRDITPPTLAPVLNKTTLWPPNHKMVDISIDTHALDDSGVPVYLQASVISNEPAGGSEPDWSVPMIDRANGTINLQLRAKRSGQGSGRIYTITIIATDDSGNSDSVDMEVFVPHDKKKKG